MRRFFIALNQGTRRIVTREHHLTLESNSDFSRLSFQFGASDARGLERQEGKIDALFLRFAGANLPVENFEYLIGKKRPKRIAVPAGKGGDNHLIRCTGASEESVRVEGAVGKLYVQKAARLHAGIADTRDGLSGAFGQGDHIVLNRRRRRLWRGIGARAIGKP